jgi:glyoxylase-like metal-dependent hydrolase (beta-lactamase superfamily II)
VKTDDGVVLIDPGGSWQGAQEIDAAIKGLTNQPVKVVINSGGQNHRWLGNGYWLTQGAQVIASTAAVQDQRARTDMQMMALIQFLGDALAVSVPAIATTTFVADHSFVWVRAKDTVFTSGIAYAERIIGLGEQSSIATWPAEGHGGATTMDCAGAQTYQYLTA